MPQVAISIGGRQFSVACQEGEEEYLNAAAALLNNEAQTLVSQAGRMPESQLLLMSGLMLADKTVGQEDKMRQLEEELETLKVKFADLAAAPAPEPQKIEVPVVPSDVTEALQELAARAEAIAEEIEDKAKE